MTDSELFLLINGLSGKVPFIDGLFSGFSNDYFAVISSCLILIWLWFGTPEKTYREINQRAVLTAAVSIGLTSLLVLICNLFYFRERPFTELPPGAVSLLFYKPTDSSFPANLAAVLFAIAVPVLMKNRVYGAVLLAIAILASFGRIYVGIHYPLDILGGAAFGTAGAFLASGSMRLIAPLVSYVMDLLRKLNIA